MYSKRTQNDYRKILNASIEKVASDMKKHIGKKGRAK